MLKNILNLNCVQVLNKTEQKSINGGSGCTTIKITDEIYGPYNGGVYASNTIYYDCGNGVQTGPWHGIPMQ
jgi:hypothetical protein